MEEKDIEITETAYTGASIQVLEGLEAVRNVLRCILATFQRKVCIIWFMKL